MSTQTHTAVATTALGVLGQIQVPTEKPGPGEVLIEIHYASLMAFDAWQVDTGFFVFGYPLVLGYSGAGKIAEVGDGVNDLAVGDRVCAFTYSPSKSSSMQEYAVISRSYVGKIPDNLPFDGAATISDNFVTAFWTVFGNLKLPIPKSFSASTPPPDADTPILVWGAGSSAAQYAVQLLKLAGYTRIIVTASPKHHAYLRTLGAAHTFDYNSADVVKEIREAAGGHVAIAFNPIASETSCAAVAQVLGSGSKLAILLPVKEGSAVTGPKGSKMHMEIPQNIKDICKGVEIFGIETGEYYKNAELRDNLMPKILPRLLASGAIQPNKLRLLNKGTFKDRVEEGLDMLRNNKVSGEKVVVQVR
ncbi:GroES-like protein [Rickenella mellea]|uniref:GroES-like protein n=1 Tax=Rickenella mellea TaxID=50990 RepID=A0A4Y7PWH3_9AGAM|nr:GroES-like protein [Rickenella mellea]